MAARLGNILYWLGTIIAVLTIVGAVIWFGGEYYELRQAQQTLQALPAIDPEPINADQERLRLLIEAERRGFLTDELEDELATRRLSGYTKWLETNQDKQGTPDFDRVVAASESVRQQLGNNPPRRRRGLRVESPLASQKKQPETSLIIGGGLVLFGLSAYGVGWVARYVLRGPS